jgi:hypothetical protein
MLDLSGGTAKVLACSSIPLEAIGTEAQPVTKAAKSRIAAKAALLGTYMGISFQDALIDRR